MSTRASNGKTEFRLQLAKAMQEGRIALYGGNTASDFYMREFLKRVAKSIRDGSAASVARRAGSEKRRSRGIVRDQSDSAVTLSLTALLRRRAHFIRYHSIRLGQGRRMNTTNEVFDRRAGLKVQTVSGYYDEPEYYRPEPKSEMKEILHRPAGERQVRSALVTVAQLTGFRGQAKDKHDADWQGRSIGFELRSG